MTGQHVPKIPGERGVWEHFGLEDGLPDLKIECLFADSQGQLWVGTRDRGVVRFDGDRFETFTTRDGLAGDGVCSVLEDQEGALWFGTLGGLTRYDGKNFETIRPRSGERCGFRCGCEDWEGRLWFGVNGRPGYPPAVCCWEGKELELILLEERVEPPSMSSVPAPASTIYQIAASARGDVYFGGGVLYHYDGEKFQCISRATEARDRIFYMLLRPNGELWCVLGSTDLKVYADGQFTLLRSGVYGLIQDPGGAVWLNTWNDGVLRYDGTAFQVIHKTDKHLGGNPCLDSQGRLWFHGHEGLYGWGIYCYDTTRFETFQKEQGLPASDVNCLVEDGEGRLLIGTGEGIVGYDGGQFQPLEQAEALTGKGISAVVVDEDRLWITTWTSLYIHEDGALRLSAAPVISGSGLLSLAGDRKGGVYFGYEYPYKGFSFGYCKDEQVRVFPFDSAYPSQVGELLVDRKGHLWIGSRCADTWEGVCCYDGESFKAFTQADGMAGGAVYTLYEDQEGGVWIGTTQGASRFDGKKFRTFTQAEGLPCQTVRVIAQTRDGRMWFGTQGGGVGLFDGEVFQVIQIPGNTLANWVNAIYQDRKGQIWFGTDGELVRYTPQRVPPTISLTKVVAEQTYEGDAPVEIPTTAGRISFCFQGKSPVDRASRLVYRYRLKGYENHWRQTRDKQVDYPQLKPGEYCFQVQAVDTDLNYSEPATARISVVPDPRIQAWIDTSGKNGNTGEFVGESAALRSVQAQLAQVAPTGMTVLILGETGTGKGLAARTVHQLSSRKAGPFVQVNCGSIPKDLVESELFGHEKGAFTGAVSRKVGKVELAQGGILFLDEIGDLLLEAQVKLLHLLEEKTFERVGGIEVLQADVQVVAATNRQLEQMVREGLFRQDLYFRLQVFPVRLPPLRERLEDIPLLATYFTQRYARHLNRSVPQIAPGARGYLQSYAWPGNVRELEHVLQRAVLLCRDNCIEVGDVALQVGAEAGPSAGEGFLTLAVQERRLIERALEVTGWVIYGKEGAAQLLGLHPDTLRYRMKKHGLRKPR